MHIEFDVTPRFPIGTKFLPRRARKSGAVHTVVDYRFTIEHSTGKVTVEYVSEHEFVGQVIRSVDVETTVAIGVMELEERAAKQ